MFPGLGELLLAAQLTVAPDVPQDRPVALQPAPVVEVIGVEELGLGVDRLQSPYGCCGNSGCTCNGGCPKK